MTGLQRPNAELVGAVERDGGVFSELYSASGQTAGNHVSGTQMRVLRAIEDYDAPGISTLASELGMGLPSVSRVCDRLESSGWVSRHPGRDDRRQIQVRLTAQGRRLMADMRRRRCAQIEEILTAMPPSAQRALQRGLASFATVARAQSATGPDESVGDRATA